VNAAGDDWRAFENNRLQIRRGQMPSQNRKPAPVSTPERAEPEIRYCHQDRIEPGQYRAYCRSAQVYRDGPYARWICALQFDILDDSLTQMLARLTCFLNLGSLDEPRATSRRSKYWRAWVAANGSIAPRRKDRISPRIFERRHAVVLVSDVKKNFQQISLGSDEAYSVVREIIRWETGKSNQ
jgi:hypothetical protein